MYRFAAKLFCVNVLCSTLMEAAPVQAQGQHCLSQLEKELDSVESSAPISSQAPAATRHTQSLSAYPANPANALNTQGPNQTPFPKMRPNQLSNSQINQPQLSHGVMPSSPLQQAMNWFKGSNQQPMPQPQMQQTQAGIGKVFQTLFGDSAGSSSADGSGNANRAENQASVAHNACERSYYGNHDSRSSAADEAYYAAEEARHEADAAYAKTENGGPDAQSYAESARAYADAAQADADTARANADSTWK